MPKQRGITEQKPRKLISLRGNSPSTVIQPFTISDGLESARAPQHRPFQMESNIKNQFPRQKLPTQNSDASPIPVHYMEGSATGWDVDDLAAEKVRRENAQDRIRGDVESTLPPLETRRTENTPSPNDLFGKKSKEKENSQAELASSLPKLENHSSDIAPVPVHFMDVANGNEGLFYQKRLQEKLSNFEANLSQSTSIKAKEKGLLDENAAKDDAGVEEGRDSYASLNIPQDNFYSITSPDVDIQDSLEFSVDSNIAFDQSMKHHRETNENSDDPDISNLAVAKQVYESDEELPLYEAVEYDPSANPPNHCNRKYFCLAVVGLITIGLVVAVSVVFGTKEATPQSELQYGRPTLSPTTSPTSSRALSGVIEDIEANVLRRNATFQNMTADDPRILALEWILYDDERQLDVFDSNLHQRYILALLAFSLDSSAWKRCGGVDELESCTTSLSNEVKTVGYAPWLSEFNECDWYGVTCVVGVVWGLDLANNSVIGEIVPEIVGLRSNLVFLDLSANCLYGTLPPEMGDLSSLELLKLSSNSFSGTFPEDLYKLSKLEQMDLAHQYSNDGNCTRSDGTVVYLMYQKGDTENMLNDGIEGAILDDRIGGLKNLERLILENNYFYGRISSEIGKLKRLVYFNAAVNMLTGSLPDRFTELRNLKELWVEENSLTGEIPIEVGRMESLETFSVWLNPNMTGTIPYSLYNLTKLQNLLLAFNGFSGTLSTNIGNLRRLNRLQLNDNNFSGTVPSELGLCRDLEFIRLEFNEFRGSVPEQVCSLRDVALVSDDPYIEFFNADCLPDSITSLPRLKCDCCYSCCDGTTKQCRIVD